MNYLKTLKYAVDLSTVTGILIDDSNEMIPVEPGTFRIGHPAFVFNGGGPDTWTLGDDNELWYFFIADTGRNARWAGPVRQIRGLVHSTTETPES